MAQKFIIEKNKMMNKQNQNLERHEKLVPREIGCSKLIHISFHPRA